MPRGRTPALPEERVEAILDAVLTILAREGIAGVTMRAVAREADVSLGLVNYYYVDKHQLICAALQRIEADDVSILNPVEGLDAQEQLRSALARVATPQIMTTEYLSLRLQLWSLATAHRDFAEINASAHVRYRTRLAALISNARPELSKADCRRRANDIDVVQNGVWLSSLLGVDRASLRRALKTCEDIAFGD
jgi:AcrR family transcriptional regulator